MIRDAVAEDIPQLLQMMRQLATIEGYIDKFTVTKDALFERGFSPHRAPQFSALVSVRDNLPIAYAVTYAIPFTFDLRPTVILKELFVTQDFRGSGVGTALFKAVIARARAADARLLRWQVLPHNERAKTFYKRFGGNREQEWEQWVMTL